MYLDRVSTGVVIAFWCILNDSLVIKHVGCLRSGSAFDAENYSDTSHLRFKSSLDSYVYKLGTCFVFGSATATGGRKPSGTLE